MKTFENLKEKQPEERFYKSSKKMKKMKKKKVKLKRKREKGIRWRKIEEVNGEMGEMLEESETDRYKSILLGCWISFNEVHSLIRWISEMQTSQRVCRGVSGDEGWDTFRKGGEVKWGLVFRSRFYCSLETGRLPRSVDGEDSADWRLQRWSHVARNSSWR